MNADEKYMTELARLVGEHRQLGRPDVAGALMLLGRTEGHDVLELFPAELITKYGLHYTPVNGIYCDGGVDGRNPSKFGGSWACRFVNSSIRDDDQNTWEGYMAAQPGNYISNNDTELYAVLTGMYLWSVGGPKVTVFTDSNVTILRMQKDPDTWGRVDPRCVQLYQEMVEEHPNWKKLFTFQLLDGHPTKAQLAFGLGKRGNYVSKYQAWCDKRCGEILRKRQKERAEKGE